MLGAWTQNPHFPYVHFWSLQYSLVAFNFFSAFSNNDQSFIYVFVCLVLIFWRTSGLYDYRNAPLNGQNGLPFRMIRGNPQVPRKRIGCKCRVPFRRAPCSTASCRHHRHCNRPIRTPPPARNPVSCAPGWCRRPTSVCPVSPATQIAWSTPCPTAPSNRSPRTGHYHRRWLPCPNLRTSSKVSIVRRLYRLRPLSRPPLVTTTK